MTVQYAFYVVLFQGSKEPFFPFKAVVMRLSVMCNQFVLNISGRTVGEVIKQMSNSYCIFLWSTWYILLAISFRGSDCRIKYGYSPDVFWYMIGYLMPEAFFSPFAFGIEAMCISVWNLGIFEIFQHWCDVFLYVLCKVNYKTVKLQILLFERIVIGSFCERYLYNSVIICI